MKTEEEVKEEVKKVVTGDESDTPPEENQEDESSQEVKTETTEEESDDVVDKEREESMEESEDDSEVEESESEKTESKEETSEKADTSKLEKQISNLNVALKQERESKREDSQKISDLQEQIEKKDVELKIAIDSAGDTSDISMSKINEIVEGKLREKEEENKTQQQAKKVKEQIKELSEKYNGKEGKPLYDDSEIFKWQKENNKLYLSPEEAFFAKNKNELVDYEVKQRLSKKKAIKGVEKSSTTKATHDPVKKEKDGPVDDNSMSKMISDAMDNVEREI